MSIVKDYDEPCWEVVDEATGRPPEADSGEGWAHYRTEESALEAASQHWAADLDEDAENRRTLTVKLAFPEPCKVIVCDGCAEKLDASGEGWTHFDPADVFGCLGVDLVDMDWWGSEDGCWQFCEECVPPWCEDCDSRHVGASDDPDVPCTASTAEPGVSTGRREAS